jgi:hypothetical protein
MPATAFQHEVDPKQKLLDAVGDVSGAEVFHNQVLMAVYIAPEKTRGGIIRPQTNIDEDRYQGKLGLIIKLGPKALKSDAKWSWPDGVGLYSWVFFRISDTFAVTINGQACRMIDDVNIKGRIDHPDIVW